MENNIIVREAVVRAITDENKKNREAEFVISTEATDTYGTVFKADGWDLTRYNNNPIVAYGHRTWDGNPDMIIGTSQVRLEGNQLIGKVRFESAEINPMAEKIWQKVQAGTLRMASIGANPLEYRWGKFDEGENPDVLYFIRQELLEWSIVPVGSNPEALQRSVQKIEEIRTELRAKDIEVVTEEVVAPAEKLSVREAKYKFNKNNSF